AALLRDRLGPGASLWPPPQENVIGSQSQVSFGPPGAGKPRSPAPSFAACDRDVVPPCNDEQELEVLHRRAESASRAPYDLPGSSSLVAGSLPADPADAASCRSLPQSRDQPILVRCPSRRPLQKFFIIR